MIIAILNVHLVNAFQDGGDVITRKTAKMDQMKEIAKGRISGAVVKMRRHVTVDNVSS